MMEEKTKRIPFEEALDATGFGKFNYSMVVLCGFLVMAMVFESISLSFLVAASACELQTTSAEQGLSAATPLFGIIATSHIWGYMADTRGRRKILLLSLFISFITGTLSAFSPNWIVLSILKLISSSGMSGTFALAMTLLSECSPQAKRSSVIILASSLFMTSNGVMAIIAIPVLPLQFSYHIGLLNIEFNSWRLLSLIYTMPCILCAIGVYLSVESPKYLLSVGKEDEALKVLKTIFVMNTGKHESEYQVQSIVLDEEISGKKVTGLWASVKSQTIPLLTSPLLKNTIVLSLLYVGIYMCVNPYIIWLPTVADGYMRSVERGQTGLTFCEMILPSEQTAVQEDRCVLNQTAMIVIFGISILFAFLNSVIGGIVNIFGRKRLMITILIITGIAGITVNWSRHPVVSIILFIVYLSPMLQLGLITTFTVDIYPTHLRAMAVCLTLMVGRGSAIVGINLLKYLLIYHCQTSFYLFSSLTLVCAGIAFLLPPDKKSLR